MVRVSGFFASSLPGMIVRLLGACKMVQTTDDGRPRPGDGITRPGRDRDLLDDLQSIYSQVASGRVSDPRPFSNLFRAAGWLSVAYGVAAMAVGIHGQEDFASYHIALYFIAIGATALYAARVVVETFNG
jgi:hypothetical protein